MTRRGCARLSPAAANLILSSENFVYLGAPQLAALKALLPDCRFEIVYFLRNPVHLWPSHWQELVKHGRDVTFLEYLGALNGWTGIMDPAAADPVRQLAALASCFGAASLRILCLDNIVADGHRSVRAFLAARARHRRARARCSPFRR